MSRSARRRPRSRSAAGVIAIALGLIGLAVNPAQAAPLHVNCDAGGNLQNKINAAPGGATILVKGTCDGPFSIGFKSLTLKGNPTATLDGQGATTTLSVVATGKTVNLVDLVVTGGRTTGQGGGIFVDDGTLNLLRTTVRGNQVNASQNSYGGGISILGAGTLTLTSSRVIGNQALTEPAAGYAYSHGGGIYAEVPVTLDHTTVGGNTSRATSSDMYAYAYGGGIEAGTLVLTASLLKNNISKAQAQSDFAYAYGGAVETGTLTASGTTISNNRAVSKSDTDFVYAYGGGLDINGGGTTLARTKVIGNRASADGAFFAYAYGGGINQTGQLTLEHSSVNGNHAVAHSSTDDANAFGGGIEIYNGDLALRRSTVGRNEASALAPAGDASAYGAGVQGNQAVAATNSTVASNVGNAASGGSGSTGDAAGGGIDALDITLVNATVADNDSGASGDSFMEIGGGVHATASLTTKASILAANDADSGPECFATTTSQGYNLVQHTAECLAAPRPSDVTGMPAMLGTLTSNGGPTQTMAIPTTSNAFNKIPAAACAVPFDQRGVARPQGPRCDVGAYERRVP